MLIGLVGVSTPSLARAGELGHCICGLTFLLFPGADVARWLSVVVVARRAGWGEMGGGKCEA